MAKFTALITGLVMSIGLIIHPPSNRPGAAVQSHRHKIQTSWAIHPLEALDQLQAQYSRFMLGVFFYELQLRAFYDNLEARAKAASLLSVVRASSTGSQGSQTSMSNAAIWACIRQRESGDNYATDTGNGYYGAYQFLASTWHSLGYQGLPNDASPAVQDQAAQQLQARSGWGQWSTAAGCGA